MLNRFVLEKELNEALKRQAIWFANSTAQIKNAWKTIAKKTTTDIAASHKKLAKWSGELGATISVQTPQNLHYHVYAVDGSQIYPDRHNGTNLAVINIGFAGFWYKTASSADLQSYPVIFAEQDLPLDLQGAFASESFIDALRSAHEFAEAVKIAKNKPELILFDGSLIFWHLGTPNQPAPYADYFLQNYLSSLSDLTTQKTSFCSYISNPKSRDLIDILCHFVPAARDYSSGYTDAEILYSWLPQNHRTPLFSSSAPIIESYPTNLRPYFTYLAYNDEIARIELPAWIATNKNIVDKTIQYILDQIRKGQGYPIALSEAHEQAVIREYDRQFFLERISATNPLQKKSQKLEKKIRPIL